MVNDLNVGLKIMIYFVALVNKAKTRKGNKGK